MLKALAALASSHLIAQHLICLKL